MKNNLSFKSFISGVVIGGLFVTLSVATFAEDILKVANNIYPIYVNGTSADIDSLNINGSTYLGLQDTAEALNASVKFNGTNKSIEITSEVNKNTTNTKLKDFSVPEISSDYESYVEANKHKQRKVNAELTTYKNYNAIKYNEQIFVSDKDLKSKKITWRMDTKTNTITLYLKNENILTSSKKNEDFIIYESHMYININFLGEYLN